MSKESVENLPVFSDLQEVSPNKKSHSVARVVAMTGITAALYVVATLAIQPLSYGAVQFRFSEVMVLLAFIDPFYSLGLIIGCAISNIFSTVGLIDVVFGTLGTVVAVAGITRCKNLFIATLWPTISMLIVTVGICLGTGLPYLPTLATVMFGEFVVVTCIGYPVFKVIMRNQALVRILKFNK